MKIPSHMTYWRCRCSRKGFHSVVCKSTMRMSNYNYYGDNRYSCFSGLSRQSWCVCHNIIYVLLLLVTENSRKYPTIWITNVYMNYYTYMYMGFVKPDERTNMPEAAVVGGWRLWIWLVVRRSQGESSNRIWLVVVVWSRTVASVWCTKLADFTHNNNEERELQRPIEWCDDEDAAPLLIWMN